MAEAAWEDRWKSRARSAYIAWAGGTSVRTIAKANASRGARGDRDRYMAAGTRPPQKAIAGARSRKYWYRK